MSDGDAVPPWPPDPVPLLKELLSELILPPCRGYSEPEHLDYDSIPVEDQAARDAWGERRQAVYSDGEHPATRAEYLPDGSCYYGCDIHPYSLFGREKMETEAFLVRRLQLEERVRLAFPAVGKGL